MDEKGAIVLRKKLSHRGCHTIFCGSHAVSCLIVMDVWRRGALLAVSGEPTGSRYSHDFACIGQALGGVEQGCRGDAEAVCEARGGHASCAGEVRGSAIHAVFTHAGKWHPTSHGAGQSGSRLPAGVRRSDSAGRWHLLLKLREWLADEGSTIPEKVRRIRLGSQAALEPRPLCLPVAALAEVSQVCLAASRVLMRHQAQATRQDYGIGFRPHQYRLVCRESS